MNIVIKLADIKQQRLSGRSVATSFIVPELQKYDGKSDIDAIFFDFVGIKAVNQSFLNEILKTTYLKYPHAQITSTNAESVELTQHFDRELERIKSISEAQKVQA